MKAHLRLIFTTMLLLQMLPGSVSAADLATSRPGKQGVSAQRLQRIDEFTQRFVDEGKYPGIVTMVARNGRVIHHSAVGQYGVANDKPMTTDTLFRIFSMTKPVTAVAAMMLFEEGRFQLNDPVSKFLPELAELTVQSGEQRSAAKSAMTMRQLLTHTAGFSYGFYRDNPVDIAYQEAKLFDSADLAEFVQQLSQLPLRFEPGTRYHYSVGFDVLGAVIERISGQTLDDFFQQKIFQPLGMMDTFFSVPEDKFHRLASPHGWHSEDNAVVPLPAEYDRSYRNVTLFSGGGGLVSTASDYMRFCQMLLNGGSYGSARLLGPKTVRFMTSDHLSRALWSVGRGEYPADDFYPGQSMGFGFGVVTDPALMPSLSSKGEYSWGGAAGTKFWIDPQEQLIGIALVQLMRSPWPLRFQMKNATYQALETIEQD